MKLMDYVVSTAILDGGPAVSKSDLIHQLLQHLATAGHIAAIDIPALCEAVLKREGLASTGLGQGIAMPHTRHPCIPQTMVLFALCRTPVHFDSIDGEPTDLFVLCLGPYDPTPTSQRDAMRWSQLLLRQLTNKHFCDQLRQATSPEDIAAHLRSVDDEHPTSWE